MEQLTVREHLAAQFKRAPSFAYSAAIITIVLIISAFVSIQTAMPKPLPDGPILAGIVPEDKRIDLPKPRDRDHKWPDPPKPRESDRDNDARFEPKQIDDDILPVKTEDIEDIGDWIDTKEDFVDMGDDFPKLSDRTVVIGTGPSFGGRGPLGGRSDDWIRRLPPDIMPPPTLGAIERGLRWLAKAQDKQTGKWEVQRWEGASDDSTCGVSGLALLAFLARGYTDARPARYTATIRKAVEFLVSRQRSGGADRGWFGERMYSQGICTMALSEASHLLSNPRLRGMARKAAQDGLDYILARQPEHGGFGYAGAGTDTSVTGWQVMAIKSAVTAKLRVPADAKKRAEEFLRVCMAEDASTPYRFSPSGNSDRGTPRMTAVSLTARLFMGHSNKAADSVRQAKWLTADNGHLAIASQGTDLYYIYYMSMAMHQMGGRYWKGWNKPFNEGLRRRQVRQGPDRGSWPVAGSPYGAHGGRVYTTAMACLSLEVYFKYLPMYWGPAARARGRDTGAY